jgi:hypothetical protein
MTEDWRLETEDRRSAPALAAVAALALPAMLTVALPRTLAVARAAAAAPVALTTMRLPGSLSGSALPLATKARRLPRRRSLRAGSSPTAA